MKYIIPMLFCCWCLPASNSHSSYAQRHHCFVVTKSNGGPDHWSRPQCKKIMGF